MVEGKEGKLVEFTLKIDYSRTFEEMVRAGNYDWTNDDITEKHFPRPTELNNKEVSMSTNLFHFNRSISSEDAIAEMDKACYRPATLAELLVLGEVHQVLQKIFPIIALGSVRCSAYGNRGVPVLVFSGNGRGVGMGWLESDWDGVYRFLGVRK